MTLGVMVSRCATPTQIIVEVSTDAPCNRLDTGIFVGKTSSDTNDLAGPVVSKQKCERDGFIGSAVFLPRGADDEAFAIKIITGVDATVTECIKGLKSTCIVEHRALRYEPGSIVRVAVAMDQQCVGVECSAKETCKRGACVPCADCTDPTGVDSGPKADTSVEDTGVDASLPCPSVCTSCSPDGRTCNIVCTDVNCGTAPVTCPPGRDCTVDCSGHDFCKNTIDCSGATSCRVTCHIGGADTCHDTVIKCGTKCSVICDGDTKTCHNVNIQAAQSSSLCLSCTGAKETCQDMAACETPTAGTCSQSCPTGCNKNVCGKACAGDGGACP